MRAYKMIFAVAALAVMAGCSVPGPGDAPDGVFDPYEARNRKVHAFNATVDKALLRPAGKG